MGLTGGLWAVARARGDDPVDWDAATRAAKEATTAGTLALDAGTREAYAADVRAARDGVAAVAPAGLDLPRTVTVEHRHHWIDRGSATVRQLLAPLEGRRVAGPVRVVNTGSVAATLAVLGRSVLGQYDPLAGDTGDRDLAFVHPNVVSGADRLGADVDRFRRWVAVHEVAHAAEFDAAPWLDEHLADLGADAVRALAAGEGRDADAVRALDEAMTAVEGYAELLMDRAADEDVTDMRAALDARRRSGGGPLARLVRRALGLDMKRRQYERGRAFFDAVVDEAGLGAAHAVWAAPDRLPTGRELDDPGAWLARVGAQ